MSLANPEKIRKLTQKVINKEKWWDMLSRFIDVLHINIFVVDPQGYIILPPEERKFGGRLLVDASLGLDSLVHNPGYLNNFQLQGDFGQVDQKFGLSSFSIPILVDGKNLIGYMIVGPVILNKRLTNEEYQAMANDLKISETVLQGELNEIRVVSNMMINSILDLLSEIIRDNIDLSLKEEELDRLRVDQPSLSKEFKEAAKEIYSTVHLDELLVTLLDVALKMTNTECGSVMVLDNEQGDLTIKVSRGINNEKIRNARLKLGEGIAGLAAKENKPYIIHGQEGDNRIKHLLKRSEIKQSLVLPLVAKKRVLGVLNLSTKKDEGRIEDNFDNLQHLSRLFSSAF